jgi:hypothetical protein
MSFFAQVESGTLNLACPDRAAALFMHMICAELHECALFDSADAIAHIDFTPHLKHAIDIFLYGAAPRTARPTQDGA